MTRLWLRGLLRRPGAFLGTVAGIAVAVALFASLGAFLSAANGSMTARASGTVAVDWQVEVAAGADTAGVAKTVKDATGVRASLPVRYTPVDALIATTGGTTQTTGAGMVLEIPAEYTSTFPKQVRFLTGARAGVLIAQQTASNLHVGPGDRVTIRTQGGSDIRVTVAGVIDLPQANSLFQIVGAPPQSQPVAPPDNVLLLPSAEFATLSASMDPAKQAAITTQLHVMLSHRLPPDPASAYTSVVEAAHNLDAAMAGSGQIGDNLGAALDASRADAAYATVLFLFLGLPGAALSAMLTFAIARGARARRLRDQALLRTRGASLRVIGTLVAVEAVLAGLVGGVIGLGGAALIGWAMFGSPTFGSSVAAAIGWPAVALTAGLLIAALAILLPALRDFRTAEVARARTQLPIRRDPWWMRIYLDLLLIAIAGVLLLVTTQNGYTLVLAPEGVTAIQIDYWAFFGPALLWVGSGLLIWRLTDVVLTRGRRAVTAAARPVAGNLASTASATMTRQRSLFATSIVMLSLALAFAISTAVFNATYQQQAEADARLTNGADVAVSYPPGSATSPAALDALRTLPGVDTVEPLQHRYAYVGNDLQDLFGVRAETIGATASLQNAYFQGGTAQDLMHKLATTRDAVLVSAETVKDYQLHLGDTINLRLQNPRSGELTTVPFRYVGVANEFPTAPKDSFLVANASYVAEKTGDPAVSVALVNTGTADPADVARSLQHELGTSATVVPIGAARSAVGSSLTSVDLAGLTRIELIFAFVLAAASGGVVFALGIVERRRSFAIASVLGATPRQLRSLALVEAFTVSVGGLVAGALLGWGLSAALVGVLSGVFDPPPDTLTVPWWSLAGVAVAAVGAILISALIAAQNSKRPAIESLRAT
ncbi:ABC transporter permease [Microbacterium deminutum]|uniref:ABC transporter permease n=1 Tax=Microbacterium deminutum TaxID=344164 RepID=A0ABN2R1Z1_9MICO